MPHRYAEGTTVPVEKTKQEIERLVERNGGKRFFTGWADDHVAVIGFRAQDRILRFNLPLPGDKAVSARLRERETMRRWRCLLLCLKAQFEAVATGVKSFEQAFFGDIILPNNQTVYEAAQELVAGVYRTGKMDGRLLQGVGEYTPPVAP